MAPAVTANILEGLVRVAPAHRAPGAPRPCRPGSARNAGVKGADTYLDAIDYNVKTLAQTLK
jgi:hypothetical protein